jgi:large subunit ribosomal protein L1
MRERKRSKRYKDAVKGVTPGQRYAVEEAVKILAGFPKAKFDETVNLAIKLNVDPKKAEQNLRGAVSLPHGLGKTMRVIAFAEGKDAEAATKAGAIKVGAAELAKEIEAGFLDFDVAIAHPNQMRNVGRLGKILGPKNLMPTPKAGTVTENVEQAVKEFVAGKVEYRTDAGGNIHCPIGKRSFANNKLADNIKHIMSHVQSLRPSTVKGLFIERASLAATMSPGVSLQIEQQSTEE